MDPQEIDRLSAANAVAPRVGIPDIDERIKQIWYIDAEKAYRISEVAPNPDGMSAADVQGLSYTTVCFVLMKNGFVCIGQSTPAAPENFSRELGRKFALDNCIKQLWPILGYELRTKLSNGAQAA